MKLTQKLSHEDMLGTWVKFNAYNYNSCIKIASSYGYIKTGNKFSFNYLHAWDINTDLRLNLVMKRY